MKKFTNWLLVMLVLLALPFGSAMAAAKIDLAIDGVVVPTERTEENTTAFYLEARPQMRGNSVFVPVRVVSEILGAEVAWADPNINIKFGETEIVLTVGSRAAYQDGKKITLPAAPYERGGYTYVPIRFVAEAFDCDVEWQAKKNLVNIQTKPWELNGRQVVGVASWSRMIVEIFSYEAQSPYFAQKIYESMLAGRGAEVAEPEYYGDLPNLDPPNYYYQNGNFYFLTADDSVAEHIETYKVLNNGYDQPLPEGYTEFLLHMNEKWYALDAAAEAEAGIWWGLAQPEQVFDENNYAKSYALLVGGKNFNYATKYVRLGMGRRLDCYTDKAGITSMYDDLQEGRLREVDEPQTPYGSLFEIYDYYMEQFVLGFSEAAPQYTPGSGGNAQNADYSFTVYAMLEGAPEFGEDSRYLLFDHQTGKWYVFAADYYDWLQNILDDEEKNTLDQVAA